MRKPKPIADRLWQKIDQRGPNDCWLWTGHTNNQGYGMISAQGQSPQLAHRVAYELTNGLIPNGLCVCHRCDVPLCCNPGHLFLGTHRDNAQDKKRKGRHMFGERHGCARLSSAQVEAIRDACRAGSTQGLVADRYGVNPSTISRIVAGKRRKEG